MHIGGGVLTEWVLAYIHIGVLFNLFNYQSHTKPAACHWSITAQQTVNKLIDIVDKVQ